MIEVNEIGGSELIKTLNGVFDKGKISGLIIAENLDSNIISKVFIKDGQIVYATSTMYRARFGDLMIKKGIITPKELNVALKIQKEENGTRLIGNILVEMGVISERVIPNLLYHQIEVVIYEILSWKRVGIKFEEGNIDEHAEYKRPISSSDSKGVYSDLNKLLDSRGFINTLASNLIELINIRKYFINPDAIPKRTQKSYPVQLNFDQRKILRSIDNANTLNDIIILSDLDYFRTYQILFSLATEKIITIPGAHFTEDEEKKEKESYEDSHIYPSNNPFEAALINSARNYTDYSKNKVETDESQKTKQPLEKTENLTQEEQIAKNIRMIQNYQEEVKVLKQKINEYENSKVVLSEEITVRISRLPFHKKVMLNSIIKNIMDMVESV